MPCGPRPTMRDVAVRAGVSLKTVSRVINDEPGVAAATAERVSDAIAELGFQRNDLARSLRQGRTSSTLGLVIEDVANPFYSAIAQAVEAAARERGFMLITASCEEDPERERELVQALLRRRVDALLLVPAVARPRLPGARDAEARRSCSSTARRRASRPTACCSTTSAARAPPSSTCSRTATSGSPCVADPDGALHGHRAPRRLPRRRSSAAGVPVATSSCGSARTTPTQAEAVVARAARAAAPTGARPRCSPATTATRSARCARCAAAERAARARRLRRLRARRPARHAHRRPPRQPAAWARHAAALAFERLDGDDAPPRRVVVPTELVVRGSGEVPPP